MSIPLHVRQAGSMSARMVQECTSYLLSKSVPACLGTGGSGEIGLTGNTGLLQLKCLCMKGCRSLQKGLRVAVADINDVRPCSAMHSWSSLHKGHPIKRTTIRMCSKYA